MKKKIIALLLAATAVSSALCMTACGDKDGNKGNGGTEVIENAAAWEAAFDFEDVDNATIKARMESEGGAAYYDDYYQFDGNKLHCVATYDMGKGEVKNEVYMLYKPEEIYDEENFPSQGSVYEYEYNEASKKWEYTVDMIYDRLTISQGLEECELGIEDGVGGQEWFTKFEYDAQAGVYKASNVETEYYTIESATLVFKNGKVKEFVMNGNSDGDGKMKITVSISDIGTTSVTIPETTEKAD